MFPASPIGGALDRKGSEKNRAGRGKMGMSVCITGFFSVRTQLAVRDLLPSHIISDKVLDNTQAIHYVAQKKDGEGGFCVADLNCLLITGQQLLGGNHIQKKIIFPK